jgi:hypothetical protein
MVEILTYRNLDNNGERVEGTFTRELEIITSCKECTDNDCCYVDGEMPGIDNCPLVFKNLISRAPKGN